jgi:hypothetical protein
MSTPVAMPRQTTELKTKLVAFFDKNGDLHLEGYDNEDFEWELIVGKEHREQLLLALVKQNLDSQTSFSAWLTTIKIPYTFREAA